MGGEERVKLLCSFGGDLVREQGKPFYIGGKTRLVSIQRSSCFRSLLSKMSEVCGADPSSIELKYQLSDGPPDSPLISVENDDDVRNMMDEFDPNRKFPIFLFTDRARSSDGDDYDDDDDDEVEEIANADVLDSIDTDGFRETKVLVAREPCRSQSSSRRDSVRCPYVGPSMSGEMIHKDSQSLVIGQEYEDVQSFRNVLTSAAIAANFELHMIRSDQRRVTARCAAEGCSWRVHASKLPHVNTFRIRTLTPDHTCIRSQDTGHRQATAKWIANCIREKLRQNRNYRPREIVNDIHRDYGVMVTYKRAFLGREKALEELRAEPVRDVGAIEKNGYEPIMENMDALTWGEIHDPPRKKRGVCEPCESKEVRPLHCTRCNQIGHNRRTCTLLELVQDGSS